MVFRLIGIVLEVLWAIAKREVEIDSLKERATKAEKELKVQSAKNREMHERVRTLEILRETDKNQLASLEKSLATRREFDLERVQSPEKRRDAQGERITRLEVLIEPDKKLSSPNVDDRPEKSLSDVMREMTDELTRQNDRAGYPPAPTNPTDN